MVPAIVSIIINSDWSVTGILCKYLCLMNTKLNISPMFIFILFIPMQVNWCHLVTQNILCAKMPFKDFGINFMGIIKLLWLLWSPYLKKDNEKKEE